MRTNLIIGIALIVIGAVVLGYDYNYTTTEEVLKIGPITATAEKQHTVSVPPLIGWLLIVGGAGVLVFTAIKKN